MGELGRKIFESVEKKHKEMQRLTNKGIVLLDIVRSWSLNEINDPTFEEDDDKFKEIVKKYNQKVGEERFFVPERKYTSHNLKVEEFAKGKTLNQILKDPKVPSKTKQELVKRLAEFYSSQLKTLIKEGEKEYALCHSDPHIGNFMVDMKNKKLPMAVLDRNLYLKLDKKLLSVIEKFIYGKNISFFNGLLDYLFEVNKIWQKSEQKAIKRKLLFKAITSLGDPFSILRSTLETFSEKNYHLPLELMLMIRNIQAFQNLTKEYKVNFKKIYKKTKPLS